MVEPVARSRSTRVGGHLRQRSSLRSIVVRRPLSRSLALTADLHRGTPPARARRLSPDAVGARELDHKQIALKVYEELDGTIDQLGWWTQAVTVAHEQHIGRRVLGQRPDGTFQLSVSRSTSLGMQQLMAEWTAFAAEDPTVLGIVTGQPRVSGTDRRTTWRTKARDGSSVVVTSEPKKDGTASLVATQLGLPTPAANEAARECWTSVVHRFLADLQRPRLPT